LDSTTSGKTIDTNGYKTSGSRTKQNQAVPVWLYDVSGRLVTNGYKKMGVSGNGMVVILHFAESEGIAVHQCSENTSPRRSSVFSSCA
jgi:hypothetical protein